MGRTFYLLFVFLLFLRGAWTSLSWNATLSQPRYGLSATSVDNLAMFAGGFNGTVNYLDKFYFFPYFRLPLLRLISITLPPIHG